MSYFGEELSRQLGQKGKTAMQLAENTSISASQISKWTRGIQTIINETQLTSIQTALSDDPHDHARLVLAHLLDEKFGLHHEEVRVQIARAEMILEDRPAYQSKGEAAIAFLAQERVRNRELNDLLIDLVRLLKPKSD